MEKVQRFLDYKNTYQHSFLQHYTSDMQLNVDTDSAYLVLLEAKSQIAGYFRLLNNPTSTQTQ